MKIKYQVFILNFEMFFQGVLLIEKFLFYSTRKAEINENSKTLLNTRRTFDAESESTV